MQPLPPALTAKDIMATKLVTLSPDADVFEAIGVLLKHKISGCPVVDRDGRLLGLFSEKSCMQVVIDAAYEQLPTNHVETFMIRSPQTIDEQTDLLSMAQIFLSTSRRRLPVLRDGIVVGQVSRRDVIRAAHQMLIVEKQDKTPPLYLSALREMDEAPDV